MLIFVCFAYPQSATHRRQIPIYPRAYVRAKSQTHTRNTAAECRYKILCANAVPEPCEPQKATQIILETINLESDQYRMGHTKVSDSRGVLNRVPGQ